MSRWSVGLAAGVAVFALADCAGGAANNPTTSAERFLHALAAADTDKACRLIASDEQPVTEDHDWDQCQSYVHLALASAGDEAGKYAKAEVRSADLDGDTAHVDNEDVAGVLDPDITLNLVRIDGRWYISDLG